MRDIEPTTDSRPVVLFDGHCNFCNGAVRWTATRDPLARLRFAPLRSPAARRAVERADPLLDFGALPDSIVLVDRAGVHTASAALLRIARRLRFPYPALSRLAIIIPRPLRDAAYRAFARRRYRWFGRTDECPLPPPEIAVRFLGEGEDPARAPRPGDQSPGAASAGEAQGC